MKPTKKEIICYGAVVIWAIGCFAFLNFFYHYHFFYQEQNQLFLLTKDYVSSYLSDGPGWLARLTGDFLTQFYYYLFLGPAILTVSLLCIGDFTRRRLQNIGVPALAAFGIAIILMTVFFLFSLHPVNIALACAGNDPFRSGKFNDSMLFLGVRLSGHR